MDTLFLLFFDTEDDAFHFSSHPPPPPPTHFILYALIPHWLAFWPVCLLTMQCR